mgnify:CR=1 FL=1
MVLATTPPASTFSVPEPERPTYRFPELFHCESGPVTVATSTSGASPALARMFRERLTTSRLLEYADLAPLLSEARTELMSEGIKVTPDHWQTCITEELLDMIQAGRDDEAKRTLMSDLLNGHVAVND